MIRYRIKRLYLRLFAIALGSAFTCSVGWVPTAWAQGATAQLIRIFEDPDDFYSQEFFNGVNPKFSGWAFPPGAHTLLPEEGGKAALVEPPTIGGEVTRTELPIPDPINTAFDSEAKGAKGAGMFRLFFLDGFELIAVKLSAKDIPEPATIRRFDLRPLGLTDPQGMTFGAESLFILDGAGPRIVRIRAATGRNFDGPSAATAGRISEIPLPPELGDVRGLAFTPVKGGILFVLSPSAQMLSGFNLTGELVAAVKLPGFQTEPQAVQGIVFAPTLDLSDDPSVFALYIVSSGPFRGVSEWSLGGGLDVR
jgi:hypothetical protein